MKELTKKLSKLIDEEANKKIVKMKGNVVDYHFFIENFGDTLNHLEKNGRELLEDCKTDKLKFSEAEAEGYLRAIITIKNQFKDDIEYIIHNKK